MKEVIIRLNGGLGNQMFQYAFAKAKAREADARLMIDRSLLDGAHVAERYRLDAFDLDFSYTSRTRNFLTRAFMSPKLPRQLRAATAAMLSLAIVKEENCYFSDKIDAEHARADERCVIYVGYYQRYLAFDHLSDELRKDFRLPAATLGPSAQPLLKAIAQTNSVAIHVRRGDYVSVPLFRQQLGVLDTAYYRRAIDAMRERVPNARFFIFTNDPAWVSRELATSADISVVSLDEGCSDLAEMFLMRECAHFIIANSSFSWWAAYLSERRGKTVIAPSPWFLSDPLDYADRVPSDWLGFQSSFAP